MPRGHRECGVDFAVGQVRALLSEERLTAHAIEYGLLGAEDQQAQHEGEVAQLHHAAEVLRHRQALEPRRFECSQAKIPSKSMLAALRKG